MTRGTCLAVDLVGAVVLTVVKEVTAQSGADASVVGTQELVFLTCGNSWRGLCRHVRTHTHRSALRSLKLREEVISQRFERLSKLTAVQFIRVVATVVDTIAPL